MIFQNKIHWFYSFFVVVLFIQHVLVTFSLYTNYSQIYPKFLTYPILCPFLFLQEQLVMPKYSASTSHSNYVLLATMMYPTLLSS